MAAQTHITRTIPPLGGPVTEAIRAIRGEAPPRRGFLRGLLSLPLIGGGITLIGTPSAVAEPVTLPLFERYVDWLSVELGEAIIERSVLREPVYKAQTERWRREWCRGNGTLCGLEGQHRFLIPPAELPSARAALVLSTVGCDWRRA